MKQVIDYVCFVAGLGGVLMMIAGLLICLAAGCTSAPKARVSMDLSTAVCPRVEIIIATIEAWDQQDEAALQAALRRCPQLYKKSPCLTKFERIQHGTYRAVCGGEG